MWKIDLREIFVVMRFFVVLVIAFLQACYLGSTPDLRPVRKVDLKAENVIGFWGRAAEEECVKFKKTRLVLKQDGMFEADLPTIFFDRKSDSLCKLTHAEGGWKIGEDTEEKGLLELQIAGFGFTTIHIYQENKSFRLFTYLGDADAGEYLLLRKDDQSPENLQR